MLEIIYRNYSLFNIRKPTSSNSTSSNSSSSSSTSSNNVLFDQSKPKRLDLGGDLILQ